MNPVSGLNGGSAARFGLAFIAGVLAGKGVITAEQAASFADTIINAYTSISAVVGLAAGVWIWWKNKQHAKVEIAAVKAGVDIPTVQAMSLPAVKAAAAPGQ